MSKQDTFSKELGKKLGITNPHAIPRIEKVVVNVGVGKNRDDQNYIQAVAADIAAITGQKAQERRARKAVAGFKVRENNLVGYRVTLRGKRMEDFVQRFIHVTLPRVRDFRGIPATVFDGHGNLSVGIREQLAFPEIEADQTDVIFGVEVTFVTSTDNDEQAKQLFDALGFPFIKPEDAEEALGLVKA